MSNFYNLPDDIKAAWLDPYCSNENAKNVRAEYEAFELRSLIHQAAIYRQQSHRSIDLVNSTFWATEYLNRATNWIRDCDRKTSESPFYSDMCNAKGDLTDEEYFKLVSQREKEDAVIALRNAEYLETLSTIEPAEINDYLVEQDRIYRAAAEIRVWDEIYNLTLRCKYIE